MGSNPCSAVVSLCDFKQIEYTPRGSVSLSLTRDVNDYLICLLVCLLKAGTSSRKCFLNVSLTYWDHGLSCCWPAYQHSLLPSVKCHCVYHVYLHSPPSGPLPLSSQQTPPNPTDTVSPICTPPLRKVQSGGGLKIQGLWSQLSCHF